MRLPVILATSLAATLLLSSCAPTSTSAGSQRHSTPSPTISAPSFLSAAQSDTDLLPDGVAETVQVGSSSSRYQGEWDGHQIYLALKDSDSVCLVTGVRNQLDSWIAGCGAGNEIVTGKFADGGIVKYLPMTTSITPQGWTRVSDHVFAM